MLLGTTSGHEYGNLQQGARSFDTERGGYLRLIVPSTSLFPYFLRSCPNLYRINVFNIRSGVIAGRHRRFVCRAKLIVRFKDSCCLLKLSRRTAMGGAKHPFGPQSLVFLYLQSQGK